MHTLVPQSEQTAQTLTSETESLLSNSRLTGVVEMSFDQVMTPSGNHVLQSALQGYIADVSEITSGLKTNMLLYSRHEEFGIASLELVDLLSPEERKNTFTLLGSLTSRAGDIGLLFPTEIQDETTWGYGESITCLVFSLLELKKKHKLPEALPLHGEGNVEIGKYSYKQAIETIKKFDKSLDLITKTALRGELEVARVNETGEYGMYRLGSKGQVIQTVRIQAGASFDPAMEFANRFGTQASIGFTVEEDGGVISAFKKEQRSPFCIRVDNEGDSLALDIGSILGKDGTLGKQVADLIAVGDFLRSKEIGKDIWLNHNKRPYAGKGFEKPEEFAHILAPYVADLENRWQASRGILPARLLLQAEKSV